jgi:hypothetical protein
LYFLFFHYQLNTGSFVELFSLSRTRPALSPSPGSICLIPWLFFTRTEQRKDDQFSQQNARRREEDNLPLTDALLFSEIK